MIVFYLLPNWMANPKKIAKKIKLSGDKEILSTHFKRRNSKQDKTFASTK